MNNQTKHTPGPWDVRHNAYDPEDGLPVDCSVPFRGEWYVTNAGGSAVAEFIHRGEVDARLIAAAPELLAVVEKLLGTPCPDQAFVWLETTGIADLAVAARDKATGKEVQQ